MNRSATAVLLLVAASAVPAGAEEREEIGNWIVSTRPQAATAGASPLCVLASPIEGTQPRFWLTNKVDDRDGAPGDAVLQLVLGEKSATAGQYEAQIAIAGQKSWDVNGQAISRDDGGMIVTFNLPVRIDAATKHIRRGADVTFSFGGSNDLAGVYKVPLKGSGLAGDAFIKCLAKVVPSI